MSIVSIWYEYLKRIQRMFDICKSEYCEYMNQVNKMNILYVLGWVLWVSDDRPNE